MRFLARRLRGLVGFVMIGLMGAGMTMEMGIAQPKDQLMMVVSDAPFDRVWQATLNALGALTVTREDKAQGMVVFESEWASQGLDRLAFDRVRETVTVRLDRLEPLTTKVAVVVEVKKRKADGDWIQEAPSRSAEQIVLTAISERLRSRR